MDIRPYIPPIMQIDLHDLRGEKPKAPHYQGGGSTAGRVEQTEPDGAKSESGQDSWAVA